MKIVLASRNKHKISELQALLGQYIEGVEILSLDDVGIYGEIVEDGESFAENAMIKARAAAKSGYIGLGDDSGLEVDALGGAPGVYSARYCGRHGDDEANNDLLLENLKNVPAPRTGRYVAAIALVRPGHEPIVRRGTCDGEILFERRGTGGFGYDPLFVCETGETFAEVSMETKNRISHRKRGISAVLSVLEEEKA